MMWLVFLVVLLLDYFIGDPHHWPHPIIFIGKWIKSVEVTTRKIGLSTKVGGTILWIVVNIGVCAVLTLILALTSYIHSILTLLVTVYFLFSAMAATSLKTEVMKVYDALTSQGLEEGRRQLSWLVGRDTSSLTEEEVIKGAVETTAENTIDGVLAPMFYMAIGFIIGYPVQAVFLYKTVNTLDSMIGYIQEPYKEIGWFSAKMDDWFNWLPARIGSLMMVLSGKHLRLKVDNAVRVWRRDRLAHKSPNAGHPEAAVAGLLGIQLGGTHTYFGEKLEKPSIGDPIREINKEDIKLTCRIMYQSELLTAVWMILLLYNWHRIG